MHDHRHTYCRLDCKPFRLETIEITYTFIAFKIKNTHLVCVLCNAGVLGAQSYISPGFSLQTFVWVSLSFSVGFGVCVFGFVSVKQVFWGNSLNSSSCSFVKLLKLVVQLTSVKSLTEETHKFPLNARKCHFPKICHYTLTLVSFRCYFLCIAQTYFSYLFI